MWLCGLVEFYKASATCPNSRILLLAGWTSTRIAGTGLPTQSSRHGETLGTLLGPCTHAPTHAHTHTHTLTHLISSAMPARAPALSRQLSGQQQAGVGEVQLLQLLSPERIRQSYLRPRSDQNAPVSQSQQFPWNLSGACSLVSGSPLLPGHWPLEGEIIAAVRYSG